jgi:uncharacterized membrane protein
VNGWAGGSLVAATVTSGLVAGLFAAWSYAVMPGFARLPDGAFVAAVQQTNAAILNPVFGVLFAGAVVLPAAAAGLHLSGPGRAVLPWVLVGLVLHLAVLGVTVGVHLPLNDRLAAAGDPATAADAAALRAGFEATWVRWNAVRAVLSTLGFTGLAVALLRTGGG